MHNKILQRLFKISEVIQLASFIVFPLLSLVLFYFRIVGNVNTIYFIWAYLIATVIWVFVDELAYKRIATLTYSFLQWKSVQTVIYWGLVCEQIGLFSTVFTVIVLSFFFFIAAMTIVGPSDFIKLVSRMALFIALFYIKIRKDLLNSESLKLSVESDWGFIIEQMDLVIRPSIFMSGPHDSFLQNGLPLKSKVTFPVLVFKRYVMSSAKVPVKVVNEAIKKSGPELKKSAWLWLQENTGEVLKTAGATISALGLAGGGVYGAVVTSREASKQAEENRAESSRQAEENRALERLKMEQQKEAADKAAELKALEILQSKQASDQANALKAYELDLKKEELLLRREELSQSDTSMIAPQQNYQERNQFSIFKSPMDKREIKGAGATELDRILMEKYKKTSFLPDDSTKNSLYSEILSIYKVLRDWCF